MILGLFSKKTRGLDCDFEECICSPTSGVPNESPFEEVTRLTGPYEHENVSLAKCKECGEPALYYSADVFDDFLQYWCRIDETEQAELLEQDNKDDPQRPARARAILERHAYLSRGPIRGLERVPPGYPVVEGRRGDGNA
jgi:hypothetical protein